MTWDTYISLEPQYGAKEIDVYSDQDKQHRTIWLRVSGHGVSATSAFTIEQSREIAAALVRAADEADEAARKKAAELIGNEPSNAPALFGIPSSTGAAQ